MIIAYFKYIAQHLKVLKHRDGDEANKSFFRVTGLGEMEEVLQNPNCKDLILVVEDSYDGNFSDNANNVIDERIGVFYIMRRSSDGSDFAALEAARLECMNTIKKILARMRLDAKKWHENTKAMRGFDINTVRYYSVGPIGQGWLGIRASFNLDEPAPIVEDPNDWTGE